jgi:hypothetical protein
MKIPTMWKAIVAALVAGLGVVGTALNDSVITTGEGWTIAGAVLGALGLTWAVPNQNTTNAEDANS